MDWLQDSEISLIHLEIQNSKSKIPLMFTGIHILEPRVFDYIPREGYSDIVPTFYNPAIKNGEKIVAHIAEGNWYEVSTIPRYLNISLKMLKRKRRNRMSSAKMRTLIINSNVEKSVIWDNVSIK